MKIAPRLQNDFIASFWMMLRELETKADGEDDQVLKAWVEGWYRQWNMVTSDDKVPAWIARAENAKAVELVNQIARKRGFIK